MMSSARKKKAITVKGGLGTVPFLYGKWCTKGSISVLVFPLTVKIFHHIIDITNKNQGL